MTLDLLIVFGSVVLLLVPLARFTIYKSGHRRIDDVVLFARPLNTEDFERITDPADEWLLRRSLPGREFGRVQRQRMRLCVEYVSRASHNAEILQGWSYQDHAIAVSRSRNPADKKICLLWELSQTATEVRVFAFAVRLKIGLWLLLRLDLLPSRLIPKLCGVRTTAGLDLLVSYQKMTDLAKAASQFYGPDLADKISHTL